MRRMVKLIGLAAALLVSPAAWGQATGIRNSSHDLSNTSATTGVKNTNAAANQMCIYCHTAHKALTTQLLWNHAASATTSYSWGNDLDGNAMTKSSAGTALPATLRGQSKRCLACHDGTVALGDLANIGGGPAGVLSGLANIAGHTDASGKLINAAMLIGAGGNLGGNHPISIPYAGQTGYNAIDSSVPADQVGPAVLGGYFDVVVGAACTSPTGVCTSAPASDGRNGTAVNLIPNASGGTTNVGVECTSCHEPHNKFGYARLLRVDVANASGLCRSCHNQ